MLGPREGDSHGSVALAVRYAAREEEGARSAGAGIEAGGRETLELLPPGFRICRGSPRYFPRRQALNRPLSGILRMKARETFPDLCVRDTTAAIAIYRDAFACRGEAPADRAERPDRPRRDPHRRPPEALHSPVPAPDVRPSDPIGPRPGLPPVEHSS